MSDESGTFILKYPLTGYGFIFMVLTMFLKKHPRLRSFFAVIGLIGMFAAVAICLSPLPVRHFFILFFASAITFSVSVVATDRFEYGLNPVEKETEETKALEERIKANPVPTVTDYLELDLKKLTEFYSINQAQARSSFRWATIIMVAGFAMIAAGVWVFYLRKDGQNSFLTALSVASGVFADAVAGGFLYLNNSTQRMSLHYYDGLVRIRMLGVAVKLADSHTSDKERAAAKNRIIGSLIRLADRDYSPPNLPLPKRTRNARSAESVSEAERSATPSAPGAVDHSATE